MSQQEFNCLFCVVYTLMNIGQDVGNPLGREKGSNLVFSSGKWTARKMTGIGNLCTLAPSVDIAVFLEIHKLASGKWSHLTTPSFRRGGNSLREELVLDELAKGLKREE